MALEANISLNKLSESVSHTLGNPYDHFLREKLKFSAIQFRATLIRRDLERNRISKSFLQQLPCVELECVDIANCCGISGFTRVLRTKDEIPVPLRTKDPDSFYRVSLLDIIDPNVTNNVLKEINLEDFGYRKHLKYTSNAPVYAFESQKITVLNPPTFDFKYISILSVFEDPRQVGSISCNGKKCYTDDDVFPIGADQYEALERYLLTLYGQAQRPVDNEEITINNNQ